MSEKEKAKKYDEIEKIVNSFYPENEEEMSDEERSSLGDLSTLGERIAVYFGFI